MKYLIIATLLFTACNSNSQQSGKDSADTGNIVEAAEQMVPVAPPPANPEIAEQMNAQDTLFEDGSIPTSWHNAGFDDPNDFKLFIVRLKDWVKNDQADSVIAHTKFPMKKYPNAEALRKAYPTIFDEKMKNVVAAQRLDRISRDQNGAMLGRGEIWISVFNGEYKIYAINK